jgi:hypothetical protein
VHLGTVQKGIAEALATGNAALLAHWTSGVGGPKLPAPLSLVSRTRQTKPQHNRVCCSKASV